MLGLDNVIIGMMVGEDEKLLFRQNMPLIIVIILSSMMLIIIKLM